MSIDGGNFCTERDLDFGQSTFEQDLLNMYEECQQNEGGDVSLMLGDK
jgi:hypothetical protein